MNKRELCACFNIWSNLKLNRTVKVWRLWWRVRWREMGWRCYDGEARVRNNQNVSRCKLYHETRLSSPLSGEIESELMSESAQCERHMRTRGITRNAQLSIMVSILTSHTYIEDHSTFHGTFTDAFQRWNFQGKYKYRVFHNNLPKIMIQYSKFKSPGDFLGLWASHHIWSIG